MHHLEAQLLASLQRLGCPSRNTGMVVAVSGGPDSMALLHALVALRKQTNLNIHVAHLDHDFRGDEAEVDARFVAQAATCLGLPSTIGKADPAAYQKENGVSSFEEAAREVRYSFLREVSEETGLGIIALGHTSDDLAETVLMRIMRGSGTRGLRGMVELSKWRSRDGDKQATLFRPMLGVSKEEALGYCAEKNISCRRDTGNVMMRFTRNRVRHNLFPALEEYNPNIKGALVRLSRIASLEADYLEQELAEAWSSVAGVENGEVVLYVPSLQALHPLMQRLVLARAYEEASGSRRRLGEAHILAMVRMLGRASVGITNLPKGLRLLRSYDSLIMGKDPEAACPFPEITGSHPLDLPVADTPAVTHIPGWKVVVAEEPAGRPIPNEPFEAHLDALAIAGGLEVRVRRPGDRFQPLGADGARKLQDFYVDEKVPRHWRDRVPLVVSDAGIAWVVGYRPAQWARVRQDSARVYRLRFDPANSDIMG
ncbi:MAG: tRNA lysidine(34) synthetase TilS [Dehalococcoidia bacterium]|nr:tRNA lysidine(34) synthetase TilS [Dehalococcoidia bacterium]